MSVERLDPSVEADVTAIADLHSRYLGDSPIVQFGPVFLRKFFYGTMVRDRLVGVCYYRHQGRIVGFISYNTEPLAFMTKGVRRHPFQVAWALLTGILRRPTAAVDIARVVRLMRERGDDTDSGDLDNTGEVITLVVEEAFRGFVPPDGTARVAVRLFETARELVRRNGVRQIHLLVQPDNMEANIFWISLGSSFEKTKVAGRTVHRFTYTIPPASSAGLQS